MLKQGPNDISKLETVDTYHNSSVGVYAFKQPDFSNLLSLLDESRVNDIILATIEGIKTSGDYNAFEALVDAQPYANFSSDDLFAFNHSNINEKLAALPCSLKLTGLQKVSKEIKEVTSKVYRECGFPMTCNMYITPPGNKNCFIYHIDPHKVYIMQLKGEKRWSFPLDPHTGRLVFTPEIVPHSESQEHQKVAELRVKEGDTFYISKGLLHRAFHEGSGPCIHLSFAGLQSDGWQFMKFLSQKVLSFPESFVQEIMNDGELSDEKLGKVLRALEENVKSLKPDKEMNIFREIKEREGLFIAKFGRPYSDKARKFFKSLSGQ